MEHTCRASGEDIEARPSILAQRGDHPNDISDDDIESGVQTSRRRTSYTARQTFPSHAGFGADAEMVAEITSLSRITIQTLAEEDDEDMTDAARYTVQTIVTQDGATTLRRSAVVRATKMADVSFQLRRNSCSSQSGHRGYFCYESDDDEVLKNKDLIRVIQCSHEWGGFTSDSSVECEKSSIGWFRGRILKLRKSLRHTTEKIRTTTHKNMVDRRTCLETFATDVVTIMMESVQGMRCIWFTFLYLTDIVAKNAFICFLLYSSAFFDDRSFDHYWALFWTLLPFQVLTTLLCIGLALADDDVTRWRKRSDWCIARGLKFACVVAFCGCAQLIHIQKVCMKYRAQVPTIIREVEACKNRRRSIDHGWEGFLVRQGTTRVNLNILCLTGVPFLLSLIHVVGLEWADCHSISAENHATRHLFSAFVALGAWAYFFLTIQGIIDIDASVSWYVRVRWHFNLGRKGGRVGRMQIFFPIIHMLFRVSEVMWRVVAIVGFTWLLLTYHLQAQDDQWHFKFCIVLLLAFDFLVGCILLALYSPNRFQSPKDVLLFIVCSLLLFIANIVHFIDRVGFAIPAMKITRYLTAWRLALFTLMSGWLSINLFMKEDDRIVALPYLPAYSLFFFLFGLLYWFLFATVCYHCGYDMHLLARKGDSRRLQKMFEKSDPRFPVPDIDSRTKDGRFDTALHLAANAQDFASVKILIGRGANPNVQNYNGCTPLHVACLQPSYFHYLWLRLIRSNTPILHKHKADIIALLLEANADPCARNFARRRPIDLVDESLRTLLEKRRGTVIDIPSRTSAGSGGPSSGAFLSHKVIRECDPKDLNKLFPHLHEKWVDETYHCPPQARRNIGSLIFHEGGAGYFDSGFLPSRSQRLADKDLLLRLRTVKIIGQGGFGTVAQVEDTLMPGTFYAMKIQSKANTWKQAGVECEALQRVAHPNIVALLAAFQTPSYYALLIEYCCTDMNRKVLDAENEFGFCIGLPRAQALRYGSHIKAGLSHLHRMNIAYRDLKPDNVLVDDKDTAKLADFGLAKGVPENSFGVVVRSVSVSGTMGFLAPEVFRSDDESCVIIDLFATDVYAFGMTLSIMICGEYFADKRELPTKGVKLLPPFCDTLQDITDVLRECTLFDHDDDAQYELCFHCQDGSMTPSTAAPLSIRHPTCDHLVLPDVEEEEDKKCTDMLKRSQNRKKLDVATFQLLCSMVSDNPTARPHISDVL